MWASLLKTLRVVFPSEGSHDELQILWISSMRLPGVETACHNNAKSQDSGINHALLILPETRSPVTTRELVYAIISRAKENFTLLESHAGVFKQAIW